MVQPNRLIYDRFTLKWFEVHSMSSQTFHDSIRTNGTEKPWRKKKKNTRTYTASKQLVISGTEMQSIDRFVSSSACNVFPHRREMNHETDSLLNVFETFTWIWNDRRSVQSRKLWIVLASINQRWDAANRKTLSNDWKKKIDKRQESPEKENASANATKEEKLSNHYFLFSDRLRKTIGRLAHDHEQWTYNRLAKE